MSSQKRCAYCRQRLRKGVRSDARYCSKSCRVCASQARGRHEETPRAARAIQDWLEARLPPEHPKPIGYALAIRPGLGVPLRVFPDPSRRTLRADGSMRKSAYFRLSPFEAPTVPIAGTYIVVLRGADGVLPTPIAMQGGIVIAEPSPHIQMEDGWVDEGPTESKTPSSRG
jgi:hypothetical protein